MRRWGKEWTEAKKPQKKILFLGKKKADQEEPPPDDADMDDEEAFGGKGKGAPAKGSPVKGKAAAVYVFPDKKAWPIGTEKQAKVALTYATWPQNRKVKDKVVAAVIARYPKLKGLGAAPGKPEPKK